MAIDNVKNIKTFITFISLFDLTVWKKNWSLLKIFRKNNKKIYLPWNNDRCFWDFLMTFYSSVDFPTMTSASGKSTITSVSVKSTITSVSGKFTITSVSGKSTITSGSGKFMITSPSGKSMRELTFQLRYQTLGS